MPPLARRSLIALALLAVVAAGDGRRAEGQVATPSRPPSPWPAAPTALASAGSSDQTVML